MKVVLFLLGLVGGTATSAAWLLSEPEEPSAPDPRTRLSTLMGRINVAVADGKRAGDATQDRLRNELDAYRLHPDRPGIS